MYAIRSYYAKTSLRIGWELRRQKMVKFAHLLVLSFLIVWIAGSGCIGNDSSDVEDGGVTQNVAEAGNADDSGLTPAEILV